MRISERKRTSGARMAALLLGLASATLPANADDVTGDANANFLEGASTPSTIVGNGGDDVIYGDAAEVFSVGAATVVSSDANGVAGNGFSFDPVVSKSGDLVAFTSSASNLVPNDTNNFPDVFLKTISTGAIRRISTTSGGGQVPGPSGSATISPDGKRVAFTSGDGSIVPGDGNFSEDIFIKTLATGAVVRLTNASNQEIFAGAGDPVFSPDGTKIAFTSASFDLGAETDGETPQVFVKTLSTGAIVLASNVRGSPTVGGNGSSRNPRFSADGRYVVFDSSADDLVSGDVVGTRDVFRKDLVTGTVVRLSTTAAGAEIEAASLRPVFSPNGALVAFQSDADFVSSDTNFATDIYVKTVATGAIRRISVAPNGAQTASFGPSVEADFHPNGRAIAFTRPSNVTFAAGPAAASIEPIGIYIKDVVNGALTLVQGVGVEAEPSQPRFSPAGDAIVYAFESQIQRRTLGPVTGGADQISAGDGNDRAFAGPGNDRVAGGAGNDVLHGEDGDDIVLPGPGRDTIVGGAGIDTADFSTETSAVDARLTRTSVLVGGKATDTMSGFENLVGGKGNDVLVGNGGPNKLSGGPGRDRLVGGGGSDDLAGGPGDDVLDGGSDSGNVIDTALYDKAPSAVRVDFRNGKVTGGHGTDTFVRRNGRYAIEAVVGSRFADVIDGGGIDLVRLEGGPGNDVIRGGGNGSTAQRVTFRFAKAAVYVDLAAGVARNRDTSVDDIGRDTLSRIDMVSGSRFGDVLLGSPRQNTFNGGGGADLINGRGGADEFSYGRESDSPVSDPDVIAGFTASEGDFIDLSALGVTRFVTGSFGTASRKEARLVRSGGDGVLLIDLDADPAAEMAIQLPALGFFSRQQLRLDGDPKRNR